MMEGAFEYWRSEGKKKTYKLSRVKSSPRSSRTILRRGQPLCVYLVVWRYVGIIDSMVDG